MVDWKFYIDSPQKRALHSCYGSLTEGDGWSYGHGYGNSWGDGMGCVQPPADRAVVPAASYGYGWGYGDFVGDGWSAKIW